jgi:hypothetical protein
MFIYLFLNVLFCFLHIQTMGACYCIYDVAIAVVYGYDSCLRGMFDELCVHPNPLVFLEDDRRTVMIGGWAFDPCK